jgi:hypothetical protein
MPAGIFDALGAALSQGVRTYGDVNEQERIKKAQQAQLQMEQERLEQAKQAQQFTMLQRAIEGLDPEKEVDPELLKQAHQFHLDGGLIKKKLGGDTFQLPNSIPGVGTPINQIETPSREGYFRKPSPKEEEEDRRLQFFKSLDDPNDNSLGLTPDQKTRLKIAATTGVQGSELANIMPPPGSAQALVGNATGEEALKNLDPAEARVVRKIANYEIALPKGSMAMRDPTWKQRLSLAAAYDPSFDQNQYDVRFALRKDFTSGKNANNVKSLNTVISHLGRLNDSMQGLNNSSFRPYNAVANFTEQTIGDPRLRAFGMDAQAVENELTTLFKGTGATDQEIKSWREKINSSDSPEQMQEVVTEALHLIGGRAQALQDQYAKGMGKPANFSLLTSTSRDILKKLGGDDSAFGSGGAPLADDESSETKELPQTRATLKDAQAAAQEPAPKPQGQMPRAPFVLPQMTDGFTPSAPQAPKQAKTITLAQVNAFARDLKLPAKDVIAQLQSEGYTLAR